jgi:hypothetical protein
MTSLSIVVVLTLLLHLLVPSDCFQYHLFNSLFFPKQQHQEKRPRLVHDFIHRSMVGTPSAEENDNLFALECRINRTTCQVQEAISQDGKYITILGFGSLLSERSSRLTFPNLCRFRLVRVPNYRRVFAHPTSIFLRRGIANRSTLEMASLSCEYDASTGFLATAFEIPVAEMVEPGSGSYRPSPAFVEREEEFAIVPVPYIEEGAAVTDAVKVGMICAQSTDEIYFHKWGLDHFQKHFGDYGITTIWNWPKGGENSDSELGFLRPCAIYLYHCCLAAQNMGPTCYDSFLDETFLVDRTTTLRQYLQQYPRLLQEIVVPPELQDRYCG